MEEELIQYLPHKPPILMVNKILEVSNSLCVTENIISRDNPFINENQLLEESAFIEMMAQTAALSIVHSKKNRDVTVIGFLTGIDQFEAYQSIGVGDIVQVRTELANQIMNYYIFKCQVFFDEKIIVKGELKIYEGETLL